MIRSLAQALTDFVHRIGIVNVIQIRLSDYLEYGCFNRPSAQQYVGIGNER